MTTLADRPESANAWLWQELERRYGPEQTQQLRDGYNERHRQYFQWRRRLGTDLSIDDPLPKGKHTRGACKAFSAAAGQRRNRRARTHNLT